MYAFKPILICTAFLTSVVGNFWDKCVPFYPIEVSLTAQGSAARWIFRTGMSFAALIYFYTVSLSEIDFSSPLVIMGLPLIAWCEDKKNLRLHLMGLVYIFFGTLLKPGTNLILALAAVGAWTLKVSIQYGYLLTTFEWKISIFRVAIHKALIQARRIRYDGSPDPVTLDVFRLCGVLQWASLGLLIAAL